MERLRYRCACTELSRSVCVLKAHRRLARRWPKPCGGVLAIYGKRCKILTKPCYLLRKKEYVERALRSAQARIHLAQKPLQRAPYPLPKVLSPHVPFRGLRTFRNDEVSPQGSRRSQSQARGGGALCVLRAFAVHKYPFPWLVACTLPTTSPPAPPTAKRPRIVKVCRLCRRYQFC